MSQQKNRPTPRRADATAAQRANGERLRAVFTQVMSRGWRPGLDDAPPPDPFKGMGRRPAPVTYRNPARRARLLKSGRLRAEFRPDFDGERPDYVGDR